MTSIRWRFLYTTLVTVVIVGTLTAQDKTTLTVEDAITIALDKSKMLHASAMRVQAATAKSGETNTARLPSIKAAGSYTRFSDVPPFQIPAGIFGPTQPAFTLSPTILNSYNLRLSVQQPLFTGFRLQSAANVNEHTAEATEQDYYKDKYDLVYATRSAYWNLYKAIEFKKVVDENVQQMEAHLKDVENFFRQGIVTKNEVLKVEVQLSNVRVLQLDAGNNVRLATIALNNVMGVPLSTQVELASTIAQDTSRAQETLTALIREANSRRPEIRGMEYRVEAGESGVTLARSGWFPQIYLTGNYYYSRPNQRVVPTQDIFKDTWDFGVAVSLDIWNWGQTIHQTNQAQAQLAQAQDALAQTRDAVTLEVTQSYLTLDKSREQIAVAQQAIGQAEENYRITNEKFKGGLALNSDLLDAEAALLQARWIYIQSRVDHELADARLRKAVASEEFISR